MPKYLTYLACPYSVKAQSPSSRCTEFIAKLEECRANAATKAAVYLMHSRAWNVFSPITHSHPLHKIGGMQGDWEFWKKIDTEYLEMSCRLVVLCIPGWRESVGVQAEIVIAREMRIPVLFLQKRKGKYELECIAPV